MNKKEVTIVLGDITANAGTERAVVNLANNLHEHGHKVSLISCHSRCGPAFYPLHSDVNILHLGIDINVGMFRRAMYILNSLLKTRFKPKTVIIGTHTGINNILPLIRVLKKSQCIACEHLSFDSVGAINKLIRRFSYKLVNNVVVLTERDKFEYWKNLRIQVSVIPNELSFPILDKSASEMSRKKQLLSVGRLSYQKGFDLLIPMIADVLNDFPDWRLLIVGQGDSESQLRSLIAENSMEDKILILPPTREIRTIYLESSIYVMSSRFEGLPMVLLEAEACGLPIVAFDCPTGPREIVSDNFDGFLIPENNFHLFKEKLSLLMSSQAMRSIFEDNSRSSALRFSRERIYDLWKELLF